MRIHVTLYSDLKTFAPGGSGRFDLALPPGALLKDALTLLALPEKRAVTYLINGRRTDCKSTLKTGDSLVIFPEICGG